MVETLNYNREIITSDNKSLTVFLMLLHHQRVTADILYDMYGCTQRTLHRIIATIRDSLDLVGIEGQIIYDRRIQSYVLVIVSRK